MEAPLREFYAERIPAQFNRALERQRGATGDGERIFQAMRAVNASLRIAIARDPGAACEPAREFLLEIEEGRMRAVEQTRHGRIFTLVHDLCAFEVLEREAGDSILSFLAGMAGIASEIRLTRERIAMLREIDGSIRFERTGDRPFLLFVQFGDGTPVLEHPDCQLRMDDAAHAALRSGELDIQDAFMQQQVIVEGDMQKAMQLALAVIAPD